MGSEMQSMSGNWSAAQEYKTSAAQAMANALVSLAQGQAAQGQAYGRALRIEAEGRQSGRAASDEMSALRGSAAGARGQVRAARGASGFTGQGSGLRGEVSVLAQFEQRAQALATSRRLADVSEKFAAAMSRKSGDIALMEAQGQARAYAAEGQMYERMAKEANRAGNLTGIMSGVGGAIGLIGGGVGGMKMGMELGGSLAGFRNAGRVGTYESRNGTNAGETLGNWYANWFNLL